MDISPPAVLPASAGVGLASDDDGPLIEAARSDPEAFGLIYSRYADRMYSYLRARLSNDDDAADLMQQVFIRAFQALPRYKPGKAPFAAWLFRIAANAVTDEFRRKRRSAVSLDFVPESSLPREDVPSEEAGRLDALRQSLSALSNAERELLALRFAAGLTSREIGLVLGKSEAAAQKQLNRTLNKLKEHYRDHHST